MIYHTILFGKMQVSGIEFPVIFCENIEKSLYMWEFCDKLSNTKNNVFVNTCEGVDEYEARTIKRESDTLHTL